MPHLLYNGPKDAPLTVALAHGAGAPMDSPFMAAFAEALAAAGFRAARFEFPYMRDRRDTGIKKPPNRAPVLLDTWREVIDMLGADTLVIGGKSMGGRIASMVAAEMEQQGVGVRGLVCLGYPFHAPGKPINPDRLSHLENLKTPALFCQGTRDTLGGRDDVETYTLSKAITMHWLEDGDHGFKPRKTSGFTEAEHWQSALNAIVQFLGRV
ncbi:MAG: dienelactone hydrolase family protein [Proteobacteria bacterium]|nr:dienelactone hydrolase family protein [Pseudomonadota bacterium]